MSNFRNIPEHVLCELAKKEQLARGLMYSGYSLSDEVFATLWATPSFATRELCAVVSRELTPSQCDVVLAADIDSEVLQAFLEYNDPTPAQITKMALHDFSRDLSVSLVNRYAENDETMSYILKSLHNDIYIDSVLRASPEVASDKVVLKTLRNSSLAPSLNDNRENARNAFRDLIEIRPHLIHELLKIEGTVAPLLHAALADSQFVANLGVLTAILGKPEEQFMPEDTASIDEHVFFALTSNLLVSPQLRGLVWAPEEPPQSQESTPYSLEFAIDLAVDGDPRSWDVLHLSKDPDLSYGQATRLFWALTTCPVRERLGENRASTARRRLMHVFASPKTWVAMPVPDRPRPNLWKTNRSCPTLNLDLPIRVALDGEYTHQDYDARPLLAILGDNPSSWIAFMDTLDRVGPDTTLAKLANTVTRIWSN
jgi:hypothetical protein